MLQSPKKVDYDLLYQSLFEKYLPNFSLLEKELQVEPIARDLPDIPVYDFEPWQDHSVSHRLIKKREKSKANNDLPLSIRLLSSGLILPDIPDYDVDPIFEQSENLEEDESETPKEDESDETEVVTPKEDESDETEEEDETAEPDEEAEAEPDEEAEAEPDEEADNSDGFMANTDLDRAEAMIMQIFGGDENALSNIRSRDTNRESALRNAVSSERNDAITREISKLEKAKEEADKQKANEEERKIKKLELVKNYKDAVAKFKQVKTNEEPTSQEYQLALNELEESAKKLAQYGEDNSSEVDFLKNTEINGKPSKRIKREISEITVPWQNMKGGQFSESDKKDTLQKLEALKAEPYVTTEDFEKIQSAIEEINYKPSKEEVDTERERQKEEILNAVNTYVYAKTLPKNKRGEVLTEQLVETLEKYKLPSDGKMYTKKYSIWGDFEKDFPNKYTFVDYKGVKL